MLSCIRAYSDRKGGEAFPLLTLAQAPDHQKNPKAHDTTSKSSLARFLSLHTRGWAHSSAHLSLSLSDPALPFSHSLHFWLLLSIYPSSSSSSATLSPATGLVRVRFTSGPPASTSHRLSFVSPSPLLSKQIGACKYLNSHVSQTRNRDVGGRAGQLRQQ